MTTMDRFEHDVSDWLHEEAAHRPAEHLGTVLARTATTRQRPAWSSLERWLPVDLTFRSNRFALPQPARLVLIAAVVVAILVAVVALIGSTHRRLPQPFGPAVNGVQLLSHDGDVYSLDPATHQLTPLIAGDGYDFGAAFSRDGTRLMFLRAAGRPADSGPVPLSIVVADVDGSHVRTVLGAGEGYDWSDWSPDGSRIALQKSAGADRWTLNILDVASGAITPLDLGVSVQFPTWRPPNGQEIVFRANGTSPSIEMVRPDGSGLRRLTTHPAVDANDFQQPVVSPDGASVLFSRWNAASERQRVIVLNVATGKERPLPLAPNVSQLSGIFSPDGDTIAYVGKDVVQGTLQTYLAPFDASSPGTAIGPAMSAQGNDMSIAYSPDGKAIIARVGSDQSSTLYWVPLDGSAATALDSGSFDFFDVQRLAP